METTPHKPAGDSASLVERYGSSIAGQLGCRDRVIITGTLPDVCHPAALERQLQQAGIRCFDLANFALPLRERIRSHAARLAADAGLQIEFIERKSFRKEERIAGILARRGTRPGLVHVFSAMENRTTFRPWHDKATGRTGVKVTGGKCPHYYFYFPRERLGLVYVRVPTWLPFRLRVCFNGHGWLAGQLRAAGVAFRLEDNAFVEIADWARAQAMEEGFSIAALQEDLDGLARQCVPALAPFRSGYRWSLMQVAALKKSIYSLGDLRGLMAAACGRYLGFVSALEERRGGAVNLEKITGAVRDANERSVRGFNFFAAEDLKVLLAILLWEYQISGLSNRLLQRVLPGRNGGQTGRILKRLRLHGLIEKIGRTYKCYVTVLGQKALVAALKLKEHMLLPALARG